MMLLKGPGLDRNENIDANMFAATAIYCSQTDFDISRLKLLCSACRLKGRLLRFVQCLYIFDTELLTVSSASCREVPLDFVRFDSLAYVIDISVLCNEINAVMLYGTCRSKTSRCPEN